MMTAETNATPSPDLMPLKTEELASLLEPSKLPMGAKQRYALNQIKKLVESCDSFIALVPGEYGVPEIIVSTDLKEESLAILGDAVDNFSHYMNESCLHASPRFSESWSSRRWKGKKPIRDRVNDLAVASITYPFQRPIKRHRASTINGREGCDNPVQRVERKLRVVNEGPALQIRVDDHDKLQRWFKEAFVAMQQVACRIIAKMWIKRIHPRKQSTHPYNGGVPRSEHRNPERTRPPYWPSNVPHKEPDHIGRDDRTSLLVHLLTSTPLEVITNPPDPHNTHFVTAADLLDCLDSRKPDLKEGVWDIIEQVCRARDLMEQYEAGEIDGDALVFLNNYAHTARSSYTDVDGEDPERGFSLSLQSTILKTELVDESTEEDLQQRNDEVVVFTPSSSTHGSPLDQMHSQSLDSKPPKYRKRGTGSTTVVTESSSSVRRSGGVRRSSKPSAPTCSGRSNTSSSMSARMIQELPYRSPSTLRKPDGSGQGEDMTKDRITLTTGDRRINARHSTTMIVSQPTAAQVMTQTMLATKGCGQQDNEGGQQQQPEMNNMMHDMMSSYIDTCPRQPPQMGMLPQQQCQPWMAMMPNMGPEPPDRVFGFHPHMMAAAATARAPESALAYFGQTNDMDDNSLDGGGGGGGGMLLMDTMQPYHDFQDQHGGTLMSVADMYHQQGIAQPVAVDMTSTDFYTVQH
ncbi:hypothetical protein, variant 2 [Exophiala oligosperma]|uniref:Subtelomeric hrmA-associated cluster protein AFUB-079030/YDR124W-like helical bundle domain-containing protein n=2 Tax=Chaetothyriales TaxID=34395 RepID=A0A0D2AE08_9EURO|nr:uncharacterized protein PV06_09370 [Exophiala oligosperma]XP_016258617.1 hypothetical protein, variant 1 [Exophiala oligosperma]XP_016258618.1 hypothetical protein, variant 2 [Exophiala oligosperma]KIW38400.1 hypothetical protein PV06_09370 [Exophiala oligosperma]KIW38401.1 hypothetical protein, variant 1 [Exophiala oligosperma]KIW38402.1 hypothetical protein, variant 2 [Exophiala oligosperma]